MNTFDWKIFLKQESQKAIADYRETKSNEQGGVWRWRYIELSPESIESEWLGFPGASEEQITTAETRLGIILPPSYRTFLKVTNGWPELAGTLRLRSTEEIEWLCTENQDWIDEWTAALTVLPPVSNEQYFVYGKNWWLWDQPIRMKYMQTALQISDDEEGEVVLLNPQIIHNSEWEAMLWSNGHAGINRCRSFQEMVQTIGMLGPWV